MYPSDSSFTREGASSEVVVAFEEPAGSSEGPASTPAQSKHLDIKCHSASLSNTQTDTQSHQSFAQPGIYVDIRTALFRLHPPIPSDEKLQPPR